MDSSLPVIDLPKELAEIKAMGWIKSMRKGDTGIGKTIETLLGIPENNHHGEPDCIYNGYEVEIKSHRANSKSMVTLFTLEPRNRALKDVPLMKKYGYTDKKGRLALKVTLVPGHFTPQNLKLVSDPVAKTISIVDKQGNAPWVWDENDIRLKLQNICLVYAATKRINDVEYFHVESAILALELNEPCFFRLVDRGIVKIDLRMHQKDTGGSRNRGTGFRIMKWNDLMNCYKKIVNYPLN